MWRRFRKDKEWPKGLIVVFIVVGIALVAFWPLVFIWALNIIFGLGIMLTFETWLAAVVLLLTIAGITSAGR